MFNIKGAYLAMITLVAASNYLVQFPINDWLTWGALPYPVCYLITELTNRFHGPKSARKVVYAGFILAAAISILIAPMKIAIASLLAFLVSQMLDIYVFNQLRRLTWWVAPLIASFFASIIDASIFWPIAFWGEQVSLLTWAIGDTAVKLSIDIILLTPFRLIAKKEILQSPS